MAESWLEGEAVKFAKRRGWYTRKVKWLCRRGAPDRIFIRAGRNVWIEFKRPDGKGVVSGNQISERRYMREAGAEIGVLAKAQEHCDRVIELTGTPAPKGLQNLWGLAYVADQGQRLGMSRSAFEKRWFDKDQYGFGLEPRPNAEREIMDRMGDLMFSLHPDDYAELPPLVTNVVEVRLPPTVLKEYRRFARSLYSETYDVLAVTSGALAQKLMQFANGSMYRTYERLNDEGEYVAAKETVWVHDEKLDALERIIDEAQGESVLVAYNFKFDLAAIKKKPDYA